MDLTSQITSIVAVASSLRLSAPGAELLVLLISNWVGAWPLNPMGQNIE